MPFAEEDPRYRCCFGCTVSCGARFISIMTILLLVFWLFNFLVAFNHTREGLATVILLTIVVILAAASVVWALNKLVPWAVCPFLFVLVIMISSAIALTFWLVADVAKACESSLCHGNTVFVIGGYICALLLTDAALVWCFVVCYRAFTYILEKKLDLTELSVTSALTTQFQELDACDV